MKKKIFDLLTVLICLSVFLAGCASGTFDKTTSSIGKAASDFLKSPCDVALEQASNDYEAKNYDSAFKNITIAKSKCNIDEYNNSAILKDVTNHFLNEAKNDYKNKKYARAYKTCDKVLEVSPELEGAKNLQRDVNNAFVKDKYPKLTKKLDRLMEFFVENGVGLGKNSYLVADDELWVGIDPELELLFIRIRSFNNKRDAKNWISDFKSTTLRIRFTSAGYIPCKTKTNGTLAIGSLNTANEIMGVVRLERKILETFMKFR